MTILIFLPIPPLPPHVYFECPIYSTCSLALYFSLNSSLHAHNHTCTIPTEASSLGDITHFTSGNSYMQSIVRAARNKSGILVGRTWHTWLRGGLTHAQNHFPSRDIQLELFGWDGGEEFLQANNR